jgi:predicted nucleic acid-binding protein
MSDRYFVDTNILVYAHDTAAGAKHDRPKVIVEELWAVEGNHSRESRKPARG